MLALKRGLDHEIGEVLEGMDSVFIVSEIGKWAEQTNLTAIVEELSGKKFKRKVKRCKSIWIIALDHAQRAFYEAGADPGYLRYDAIAQSYPRTGILAFVFCAIVNGQELFVTAPFKLTDSQVAELTLRGMWQSYNNLRI